MNTWTAQNSKIILKKKSKAVFNVNSPKYICNQIETISNLILKNNIYNHSISRLDQSKIKILDVEKLINHWRCV